MNNLKNCIKNIKNNIKKGECMKKKLLWIILLIFIGFIVIYGFYNNISFRLNSRKIYGEKAELNIALGPNFWGEVKKEYEFSLDGEAVVEISVSSGILSKETEVKLMKDNEEMLYNDRFINEYKGKISFELTEGDYNLEVIYYKGIFNHLVFSFDIKGLEFTDD
ncbi:MAG: hypothetical protein PWQ85_1242 [Geotoga sp.]|jgi:hypothetical protein|nr:hypothetical protein [Geotoga sp.]